MNKTKLLGIMAMSSIILSCGSDKLTTGIDQDNLDLSVSPAEDFYEYACGGWMRNNPLPAAYSRYGSFDKLGEENDKRINAILDELKSKEYEEGTLERKLSDLYKLATDSAKREQDGIKPVMPIIEKLEAATTIEELFEIQLSLIPYGDSEFIRAYLGADQKNASENILNVNQGGLTLGQKEYYLDTDSITTSIREAYKNHIIRMFQLFGFSEDVAKEKMESVLKLETAIAKFSKSRTELRDVEANYNKTTLAEFDKNYPHIQLEKQMNAKGISSEYIQDIVVGQPSFLNELEHLLRKMSANDYRNYMEWGQINGASAYLSNEIVEANFDFYGKVLRGSKELHPLWKRATSQVEGVMGEALGKIYCEKYFPASSKERMIQLISNLQTALAQRLEEQTWMSDSTKSNAKEKLESFYVKVGYPDKWTDMSDLQIDPSKSYYENIMECNRFWVAYNVEKKAGKPVDKDEWYMYPQTVNAYYNPTTNEICFPAGILQPPFFDANADDAFNYGAIGVVIGHEMTHGFDDQGRHYDKTGNMSDWWTETDAQQFGERTQKYADFFSAIEVTEGLNCNGQLTLGENLADHGGLQVAYCAFKNATADQPLTDENNLTPEQRFFIAYAGVWAANITEEEIRNRTKSDPHALGRWRVNGALPHVDAWYEAFDVKEGDKMFIPKSERLDLW